MTGRGAGSGRRAPPETQTFRLDELFAVPPLVVTLILPLFAFDGTFAVIFVAEATLKLAAFIPSKSTAVAPLRFLPVIVTVTPALAVSGVKLVIDGIEVAANADAETASATASVEAPNPLRMCFPTCDLLHLNEPVACETELNAEHASPENELFPRPNRAATTP
jgi:hypothetical protein